MQIQGPRVQELHATPDVAPPSNILKLAHPNFTDTNDRSVICVVRCGGRAI